MRTFSGSEFRARLAAVQAAMAGERLSVLLIHAVGSAMGMDGRAQGHMRFLANWDGYTTSASLIVPASGDPILLVAREQLVEMAERMVWFADVRWTAPGHHAEETARILETTGNGNPRIGLIGRGEMSVAVWEALAGALADPHWVDATHIVSQLRTVKTEAQLAYHRRGADICDRMFETLMREVGKGKRAYQLKADMELTALHAGCEQAQTWMAAAPVAEDSHYLKEMNLRVPQAGDQLLAGVNVMFEGHWAHSVRSGALGTPRAAHREMFDLVLEMQQAALGKLRPGGDLYDVYRAAEAILSRHHPGWRGKGILCKRLGHSLGMSYDDVLLSAVFTEADAWDGAPHEAPEPVEIETGMLFEVHPMVYVPGLGGGALGDMVLATGDGNEILTRFPRELIQWDGG